MPELANQVLDKYKIVEEIGHGGFATVYRAKDTELEREVALKVLDPLLMRDSTFVERFQREARSAARLEHPQIVPIYDVGEGAGRLFISMRLIRGPSLAQYLAEKERLSWEETLRILNDVGDALAYAHEEGIIHRDLKPDNILLDERSGALLTDFGFARLVGTSSLTQSISGGIVGTPAYIPPEIWEDAVATPATDVYALACVIYEMLTGKVLFDGSTPMAIMRAHDRGAHLPEEWPKDIPSDARPILLQALARKPEQRYATVQAFLEALNAVQTAAVKQRIVEKAERLYDEMNEALENGAFADAVALGEELLSLQPDHARARQRLQEAKSRFERFNRLLNQIEAEQERLDAKERERKQRASRAHTRLTEVTSTQAELKNERENIQQRLTEVTGKLQEYNVEVTELQQQLQAAERQRKVHQQAKEHIKNILSTLQAGDLQTAQQKFSQVDFTRGDIAEPEVIVEVDTSDEHFTEDGAVIEGDNLSHKTNSVKKKEIWALAFAIFIMLLIMFVASAFR